MGDIGACPVGAEDDCACAGNCPLGGWGADGAVFEREAELPFGGAKVGAGKGGRCARAPAVNCHRRQTKGFRHG